MAHQFVKPEVLVKTAVGMLEQELVLPRLVTRMGIDQFKGAADDTVNMTVEGVLPFHEYAWRNDRSQPIVFDEYRERKIAVKFGGNVYSAVKVTDEVNDFDIENWGQILRPQVKAVARGLERSLVNLIVNETYEVQVGAKEGSLRRALVEARRALNMLHAPREGRILVVGANFESALLLEKDLTLAQAVGDSRADNALTNATIGSAMGFTIVVDYTINPDEAYALTKDAFVMATGAPSIPAGVAAGASTSFEGFAMRWIRDYESAYLQERSVVNTYAGTVPVRDVLVGWNEATKSEVVSTDEYFVRGIKMVLGGTSVYPTGELATLTGIKATPASADGDPATV